MLRKRKKLAKGLKKDLNHYIEDSLSKGYSIAAIRKGFITYGYDEEFTNNLLRNYTIKENSKKILLFVPVILIILLSLFLPFYNNFNKKIILNEKTTGLAILDQGFGCCGTICQATSKRECPGTFHSGEVCVDLEVCNVGCCIDDEGYCYTNYLHGTCASGNDSFVARDCNDIPFCTKVTDKPYNTRLNFKHYKTSLGFSKVEPVGGNYGDFFNIGYFVDDKANVEKIRAILKLEDQIIASLILYDDGGHNDKGKNDGFYANNWQSSKMDLFSGFRNIKGNIEITGKDGTKETENDTVSFVMLNNNKCLPILNQWQDPYSKIDVIFAKTNYQSTINKFENDVNNFLNNLFFNDKFKTNKDKFNFYRIDENLASNLLKTMDVVNEYCNFVNATQDIIIIFDETEKYCKKERIGVIRTNPLLSSLQNISQIDFDNLDELCSFVITPQGFVDIIIKAAIVPKVTILTQDRTVFNESNINITFSISDNEFPVKYIVYLNDTQAVTGSVNDNLPKNATLYNLSDGDYFIDLEANDKDGNYNFSNTIEITVKK